MAAPRGASGPPADSDLDDLLGGGGSNGTPAKNGGTFMTAKNINLDPLTQDAPSYSPTQTSTRSYASRHQSYYTHHEGGLGCLGYITACCWLTFQSSPKCGWMLTLLGVGALAYGCVYMLDPVKEVGVVTHDWTSITSSYDLKAGDIDHWCLKGDDSSCRCEDPLIPAARGEYKSWTKAHAENKRLVNRHLNSWEEQSGVDVAFLGESLVEEMDGRWLGMTKGEHLEGLAKLYEKRFSKSSGANIEGVPLGIAGDTAPNVLWRLMHGEMPDGFNPRVWWISLGMNDIARMQCSEEVVIMGILRVVEEIRSKKPDAKIVINSLLPMHDMRSGAFPMQNDYQDAFRAGQVQGRGRFGNRGKVTNAADASHFARKPSKAIQGEKEGDTDTGRKDKFPKIRRLAGPGGGRAVTGPVDRAAAAASGGRTARFGKKQKESTPEEKRAAEMTKKRARMQELMKKRQAFMQKQLAQRLKNDKVNPVLRDRTKYKRLDPKRAFMKPTAIPLWPAINVINNNLRRFCEKHDHVTFFDATDIFAERSGRNAYVLKSNMISVRGHPTESGFRAWENTVSGKLLHMLKVKPGLVGTPQSYPESVLPAGKPVIPDPPEQDEISESERSVDESKDEEASSESQDDTDEDGSASEDEDESESESEDADGSEESAEENEIEDSDEEDKSESTEDLSEEEEMEPATVNKIASTRTMPTPAKKVGGGVSGTGVGGTGVGGAGVVGTGVGGRSVGGTGVGGTATTAKTTFTKAVTPAVKNPATGAGGTAGVGGAGVGRTGVGQAGVGGAGVRGTGVGGTVTTAKTTFSKAVTPAVKKPATGAGGTAGVGGASVGGASVGRTGAGQAGVGEAGVRSTGVGGTATTAKTTFTQTTSAAKRPATSTKRTSSAAATAAKKPSTATAEKTTVVKPKITKTVAASTSTTAKKTVVKPKITKTVAVSDSED